MKKPFLVMRIMVGLMGPFWMLTSTQAQTVLSGDHVIDGGLDVGTTGNEGNLQIEGQTGINADPGIRVTGDGGVLFEGVVGQGKIPFEGSGARLMWYPGKAAFRVGAPGGGKWNDVSIGQNSTAFGESEAKGLSSIAMSKGTAGGTYSTAMSGGDAYGGYSTAMSGGIADFLYSTAMSGGLAGSAYSTAMTGGEVMSGQYNTAISGGVTMFDGSYNTGISQGWAVGESTVAMSGGEASGRYSTAMSEGEADGSSSVALSGGRSMGRASTTMSGGMAEGDVSVAAGAGTASWSYRSIVVGSWNTYSGDLSWDTWVPTEPIFVVGNGTGAASDPPELRYSDAFVIRKNGNFEMNGKITMPRQGDILMGEFGETEP